jgi:hypothetical protein
VIDAEDARVQIKCAQMRVFGAAKRLHHSFEDPAAFLGLGEE